MSLWPEDLTLEQLNSYKTPDNMHHWLDINFTEIGEDYIKATMPVTERNRQPMGLLHGGASVVLAESLGSQAAVLVVKDPNKTVRGLEISANHIRAATSGLVTGTVRPLHMGRTTQVWDIRIADDQDRTTCISRLTTIAVDKK